MKMKTNIPNNFILNNDVVEVLIKRRLPTSKQLDCCDEEMSTKLIAHRNKSTQTNFETIENDLSRGFVVNTQYLDAKYNRHMQPIMLNKEVNTDPCENDGNDLKSSINSNMSLLMRMPRETVIRSTGKNAEIITTPTMMKPLYGLNCSKCA